MTRQTATQTQQQTPTTNTLSRGSILQRKCESCGQHTIAGGECGGCTKKKSGLQRKLTIGASNDPLEREADQVADQVMTTPVYPVVSGVPPRIQRRGGQMTEGTDTAPASVDHVLASPGNPLDPTLQQDMGQRFGHDFSRVRVHTGAAAERSAREVNASAYTVGHNIVFGTGRFSPATLEGQRLIAHELAHVVQQIGGQLHPMSPWDKGNNSAADTFAASRPTLLKKSPIPFHSNPLQPMVQRQPQPTHPGGARPALRVGQMVRGRCELRTGVFLWNIIPGAGPLGGCFNVQIVFLPGRTEIIRIGERLFSPAVGARWVPDTRPIALVQTVASRSGQFADRPTVDASPDQTTPFYGAALDRSSGTWRDEPSAVQGCSSLPRADTGSGHGSGSYFSRPGAYGAVINDSPMINVSERKDFQTVPVVMETGQPLASLTWTVEHNGRDAVVGQVACHDNPQPTVEFGTPGHGDLLPGFYTSSPRSVVDGFAMNSSTLPSGAPAILDRTVAALTGNPAQRIILSGASTPDESNASSLSQDRAQRVADYLISHGVNRSAIIIEAFGTSFARQPISTPGAEERNRRVHLTLIH